MRQKITKILAKNAGLGEIIKKLSNNPGVKDPQTSLLKQLKAIKKQGSKFFPKT